MALRFRAGVVWLLIGAVCVYSASGCILRMMGPQHWHAESTSTAHASRTADLTAMLLGRIGQLLADAQALADATHARAHALGAAPHHHQHSALLRHWHSQDDSSVRVLASEAVDPELADMKAAAAIGGATLLLALAPTGIWRLPASTRGGWPAVAASRWRSAERSAPLEPPIA